MFVDINLEIIALQNHVMTFSVKIVMQIAKHIYQLVIYQHPQHVQLLEQNNVLHIQLQEQIPKKQPFAIHN